MNKASTKIYFRNIAIILIIAMFFIVDRYLKIFALKNGENNPISLVKPYFLFNFTGNNQIAFSIPLSGPLLNIVIISLILGIIFVITRLIIKTKKFSNEASILTFILFGAISNIVDRLQYGFVVDYLELKNFTVFNIADAMISLGALILILQNLKFISLCSKETSKTL